MKGWAEGLQDAIRYIEDNLTEELDVRDIAARAYVSSFYFQRIFCSLCGFTLGEYIRFRRLTLAGEELNAFPGTHVIDMAYKYGYDSPDSFSRAFIKFHGITPSAARARGAKLKSFAPLRIRLTLKGGTMLEYKIVEKAAFTVVGFERGFNMESSYKEIPEFWDEHMKSGRCKVISGMYGVCYDVNGKDFNYMIADNCIPRYNCNEIPEGCVAKTFPAGTWAVFPCKGKLPDSLQKVNTAIWDEWLPNCKEYELAGNYNIEMYTPSGEKSEEDYSEIWVPVKKA